jgi:hypothetical protein
MHPVHILPPYFHKNHSNIILPSMSESSAWCFPFRFSDQNFVCIPRPSSACYMSWWCDNVTYSTLFCPSRIWGVHEAAQNVSVCRGTLTRNLQELTRLHTFSLSWGPDFSPMSVHMKFVCIWIRNIVLLLGIRTKIAVRNVTLLFSIPDVHVSNHG